MKKIADFLQKRFSSIWIARKRGMSDHSFCGGYNQIFNAGYLKCLRDVAKHFDVDINKPTIKRTK